MNTILVDLISLIQSVGMQASDFILQQHGDVALQGGEITRATTPFDQLMISGISELFFSYVSAHDLVRLAMVSKDLRLCIFTTQREVVAQYKFELAVARLFTSVRLMALRQFYYQFSTNGVINDLDNELSDRFYINWDGLMLNAVAHNVDMPNNDMINNNGDNSDDEPSNYENYNTRRH